MIRVAYVGSFAAAALVCFVAIRRAPHVATEDTERGFVGLLAFSGTWAAAQVGRLLSPVVDLKISFYMIGLVTGLATVGAWLYFCSAYTGHDYHRRSGIRQVAFAVYVLIVGVKLTNPLHDLYFTTAFVSDPFPHLVIHLQVVHWIVTGLAYSLSAVGFYLLYEMFSEVESDTRTLGALVAVTSLPAIGDVVAIVDPDVFLTLNYEPIGVAVFAVGVLYVVDEQFAAVPRHWRTQVIDTLDEAVIITGPDGTVRDFNDTALDTFPVLGDERSRPFAEMLPGVATAIERGDEIIDREIDGRTQYYLLDSTELTSGSVALGRAIVCTDITEVEHQRRELRRQNEQFDEFAAAITHELRNTLNVAEGYLDMITANVGHGTTVDAEMATRKTQESISRMDRIVGDLATLARYGQTLDQVGSCEFHVVAEMAWAEVAPPDATLEVTSTGEVSADRPRLIELFRSVFEYADASGATEVTAELGSNGFTITMNCEPIPPNRIEDTFSYGKAVPSAETGMLFPTIRTLGQVHGWSVSIDPQFDGGVRTEVSNVTTEDTPE
jgi:signal transduction histidine kinase